ncbi:hypothetical protein BU16DRAFT_557020 [Lophium mytilinum]|uniref:Uncharacterized protein n=1 Tax=Lophium mytilinum TaxID=390894 RepID=A0A6A6R712_9PEZI|nr:hypothetical protein BU16DRAFT_557020 [Lophium mytilinum]
MLTLPANVKRRRDDDSDSADDRSLKRSRSRSFYPPEQQPAPSQLHQLPLRLSETPPRYYGFPDAMTPAHSEHSSDASPASVNQDDVDMDDDDLDIICSQPPDSPTAPFLRPPRLNAQLFQESNSGGRIPTPIHGAFYSRLPTRSASDVSSMDLEDLSGLPVLGRKPHERDRCMPSPISEDEATESQLSRLSVGGAEEMDMEDAVRSPSQTTKTGRARSGAFTDKRKFSMGYRDDCDKCRARVPGHYSHFLPA